MGEVARQRLHLEAELLKFFDLLFYLVNREALIDTALFQKTFELIASGKTEHSSQFRLGDMADFVLFEREGFQGAARQILAGAIEPAGDVVRNLYGSVHVESSKSNIGG